jgi:hypothetical protein
MDYLPYLHKDRNSDFGVGFPDFPGCIYGWPDAQGRAGWRPQHWRCTLPE